MITNQVNDKLVFRFVFIISIVVFITVLVLSMLPKSSVIPSYVALLPKLNAVLNGTCSFLLLISLYQIKRKKY